eukprot:4803567-Alexandrium_andersonii.AAC.1
MGRPPGRATTPHNCSLKLPRGAFCAMFRADPESADENNQYLASTTPVPRQYPTSTPPVPRGVLARCRR